MMILRSPVACTGLALGGVVGFSASPEWDHSVCGSDLKGACGVATRFAALTPDPRSSDQGTAGYRGRPSCGWAGSVVTGAGGGRGSESGVAGGEPAHAGEPP